MPLSGISWTKPVTSKLRKKSLRPSSTNSQSYVRNGVHSQSQIDEQHDSRDRWSLVSPSEVKRTVPLEKYVEASEGVDLDPPRHSSTLPRNQPASDSPAWSLVDAGPSQDDATSDLEYDNCLSSPSLTSDPQSGSELDDLVDYRGARSYWNQHIELDDLGEQVEKLKVDHRSLCGASRELFKKQENQLYMLQNARWQIAASQDEVEKHIGKLKSERAQMQELGVKLQIESALKDVEHEKTTTIDADHMTKALLRKANVRDFAIFMNIGQAAQRNRSISLSRTPQLRIEHPKTNFGKDFPYKSGSFIHRDVQAVHLSGVRVGWDHKHMPSHKRSQVPRKPTTKCEVLIEIGRLPVSERVEALFSTEKFPSAVSPSTRKRETRWFTARTMADLLNRSMVVRDDRHDSVAEQA